MGGTRFSEEPVASQTNQEAQALPTGLSAESLGISQEEFDEMMFEINKVKLEKGEFLIGHDIGVILLGNTNLDIDTAMQVLKIFGYKSKKIPSQVGNRDSLIISNKTNDEIEIEKNKPDKRHNNRKKELKLVWDRRSLATYKGKHRRI